MAQHLKDSPIRSIAKGDVISPAKNIYEVKNAVSLPAKNIYEVKNAVSLPDKNPPDILKRMIELLTDVNLTMNDVDDKLVSEFPQLIDEGWKHGSTRKKVKKYPILARTASEARAMIWRELGRSKADGFKVISDALEADTYDLEGNPRPNHDIRLKASDRMLSLMGENSTPAGAKMNINIGEGDHKIMIITSGNKTLDDI